MRILDRKYTEFSHKADVKIVKGLQPAEQTMTQLSAAVVGTLAISIFNTVTGVYGTTATKADITLNNPKFKLAYKDGDGTIISLAEMSKDEIIVEKVAYRVPLKQVTAIGWNNNILAVGSSLNYTTVVAGDEFIVRITDTTLTGAGQPYNTLLPYTYTAKPNDTVAIIMANLAAQINNATSFQHKKFENGNPYTATVTNTTTVDYGLQITTVEFGETFSVAVDGQLQYATNNLLVSYNLGNGSAAEVAYLEEINQYNRGNAWRNEDSSYYYPSLTKLADATRFYTRYKISNKDNALARRDRFKTNILIYVEQANAITVSTILDILLP